MHVRYINKPMMDYFKGMNFYAAKSLRIVYPFDKNTIVIVKGLPESERDWLIEHEMKEAELMKNGIGYREAHAKTLLMMGDYKSKTAALKDADRMIAKSKNKAIMK